MPNNKPRRTPAEILQQFSLFREGREPAFKFFYDLYHRPIYLFILNLLHSDSIAEEITDDVFLLLWNDRDKVNDPHHLASFLYVVARRQAIAHLVNAKKQSEIEAAWARYQFEWITQFDEVKMTEDKILSLLFEHVDHLPPKQKEVFIMSFSQRLDVRTIAERLGTSEKNVYKHLAKAYQYFTTVFPRNHLVLILLMTMWK